MSQPSPKLRLALVGYGKMGKEVERIALERGMEVTARVDVDTPSLAVDGVRNADVVIHFAFPATVVNHISELAALRKSVVLGTTGWQKERSAIEHAVKASGIGLVHSSNFSIGVNLLNRLVREAGLLVNRLAEYDVAVHEIHHKDKLDAPSGTALSIASILLETVKRKKELLPGSPDGRIRPDQLQVSSGRYGSVVGMHRVVFDSAADTLEIVHTAKNRSGFALGAVLAAEWIRERHGMFTFEEVLEDLFQQR
ncbi:MAG: 4-hydroxy-tetrahydrodipicolinate reductase [Ignavibacteria bacterium GWA2_54_16]|nr:MAG: 4-hydroxy-tetrahydrodipicolinate reductase [Ignavibacteria bacterium GWA2_54_16]